MVLYLDFGLIIDLVSKGEDPCMNVVRYKTHQSMIDTGVNQIPNAISHFNRFQ